MRLLAKILVVICWLVGFAYLVINIYAKQYEIMRGYMYGLFGWSLVVNNTLRL